jgi:hypothetical protein
MKALTSVLLLLAISLNAQATIIELESSGSWLKESNTWNYTESRISTDATVNLTNADRHSVNTTSNNTLHDNGIEIGTYDYAFVQHDPYAVLTNKIKLPEISVYEPFINNWLTGYDSTIKTEHNSSSDLSILMHYRSYNIDSIHNNNPDYQKYQTNSLSISLCNTMRDTWTAPSNTGQYGQFLQIYSCLVSDIDTDMTYDEAFNFNELPALIRQSTQLSYVSTFEIYDFTRDHDSFPTLSVYSSDTTINKEQRITNFTYLNVVNKVPEPSTIFLFLMAMLLILVNRPIR